MKKLYELIKELCPEGVEKVSLNSVLDYEQPTKYIIKETDYNDDFPTPVLTAGQTFILGYTNETKGIYLASRDNTVIIFDDFTTSFHWVDFNFKIKSSAMKMIRVKKERERDVNFRYIYHCMRNINYEPVDHTRQWIAKYSIINIPLPPLPVQEEIVRLLDHFTEITRELTEELTKELVARKKQYKYYRDDLLSFGDELEWKTLDEIIVSLKTGLNPRQNFKLNDEGAKNYYVTVREIVNGNIVYCDKTDMVTDQALSLINNRSNLEIGDVLFSGTGTVGRTAVIEDKPVDWNIKEGVYSIKPIKEEINSNYLAYLLNTSKIVKEYSKKIVGSPVCSLPMKELRKLLIPVPHLGEQERIVDILVHIDNLCDAISNELPKEIRMRQVQYEYYRDRLLTFDKIEE